MRFQLGSASRLVFSLAALGLAASAAHAQTQDLFVSSGFGPVVRFVATGPSTFSTTPIAIPDTDQSPKQGLLFDAQGNLFVANQTTVSEHVAGPTPDTFGAIVTLSSNTDFSGLIGIGLDPHGNLFAADFDEDYLIEFASTGAGTFGTGQSIASVSNPYGLAVDAFGNVFITSNTGAMNSGSIIEFSPNSQGKFGAGKTIDTGLAVNSAGLTFDAQGDLFSANGSTITEYTAGSSPGTFSPATTVATGLTPDGIAFDARGNLFAVTQNSSIVELASTGNGTFGPATTIETGLSATYLAFGPSAPAAVPEASTTVSFGLLLTLGLGGVVLARRRKAA